MRQKKGMMSMSRIDRLSPEQEARFGEFVEKWTNIGLCTEPANRRTAEAAISAMYRYGGLNPPQRVVWCGSPLSLILVRDSVRASVWASVRDSVVASVRDSVLDSVLDSVRASVEDSVRASVWASVRDSVRASVRASVVASVRDSVEDSVWDSVRDSVRASVRASVRDSVRASVRASVRDSVEASVWDSVRDSVRASVRDSVEASVWDSVRDSVRASVRASVEDSVEASVWDSVRDSVVGQHEASWLCFYDYFREVCGLTAETDPVIGLMALARSAGWCLPYRAMCLVAERHSAVHRDNQGRLHAETGPALAYPDGWEIWAWHGVRVPQEVIERPQELEVKAALNQSNVEVRRVMLTRIGPERLQAELPAKALDEDIDGRGAPRKLFQLGDIRDRSFVGYTCPSTGRVYPAQPVPPEVRTCAEAVAWRFGALDIDGNGRITKQFDYMPQIEG